MTTLINDCPSVFDAGLPAIAYDHLTDPEEAQRILADARWQAPIAIGRYGPEVFSYRTYPARGPQGQPVRHRTGPRP